MVSIRNKEIRIGDTFGNYTVVGTYDFPKTYRKYVSVECSCGSPKRMVLKTYLRQGVSKSCGCLQRLAVSTHGLHKHPIFIRWRNMMSRCYNKSDKRYIRYGGRGITVCARWHEPKNFIEDMYPTFRHGLSLDRIDNNLGYSPENCRWITMSEQSRNKGSNIVLTHNGETLCIAEWSRKLGICYGTLWDRYKQGWTTERIVTTPARKSKRVTY